MVRDPVAIYGWPALIVLIFTIPCVVVGLKLAGLIKHPCQPHPKPS